MEGKAGILVFGAEYNKTGEMDKDLMSRLTIALRLWKNNQDLTVIVTGGTHHSTEDRLIAEDMKDWLLRRGVPEDSVYMEDKSYNSWTNLVNSFLIIKEKRWKKLFLVSNKLHLLRIRFYIWRLKRKDDSLQNILFVNRASEYLDLKDFIWEAIVWVMPLMLQKKILLNMAKYRHLR